MDTKWKNWKKGISLLVFVLGVSLTLEGLLGIWKIKPTGVRLWQIDRLLEEDYQRSEKFRNYISSRLDDFLIMAVGGSGMGNIWQYGDGVYYDFGYSGEYGYDGVWDYVFEQSFADAVAEGSYGEEYGQGRDSDEPYDEKERNLEIIRKFHDWIKGDENLLYSISYDGKTLYSNGDLPVQGDGFTAPEGYNFLLYFDGEKVRIVKDGEELDVYGDGYYREGSQGSGWYVPGYRNFQANEETKKVKVCMAVAKEPVMYVNGAYENGGARSYDNALYWMDYNFKARRNLLLEELVCLAVGLALLVLSLACRKSRREAKAGIARLQSKIWVECKVLYFILLCGAVIFYLKNNPSGLWTEFSYFLYEDYQAEAVSYIVREMWEFIPNAFFILVFWSLYLLGNDVKYNKKIWKRGLAAKLHAAFSSKGVNQPLARKIAWRNRLVFLCAAAFGVWMLILAVSGTAWRNQGLTGILALAGTGCFLLAAYMAGKKNMETARDLEELSRHIGEIRSGNYSDGGRDLSGHDLEDIMAQLGDIGCGMAKAVDEQMRSQRMKVELIANVSHDIKTPLTSIISYVQFLKQEEGLPEHVRDYVAILDEKSQRLKNMVQDVFAVSKAASGELPMHMEELDFGKLLHQTLADMEEEIGASPVVFRAEIPKEPVMIMADGQRMYRVFQNLFQNAIKYSLEGSRVYVSLKEEGKLAVASVKNASRQELEKGMDFAERFARGDRSRTDGGSGLGLSIAQSFTEACGGEFSWETDADLFVVKISFQRIEPKASAD